MTTGYEGPLGIGQLAIQVADLEHAVAFYRDVLHLRFLFQAPPGLAFLDCGGVRLMLTQRQEGETEGEAPDAHLLALMAERPLA
jgi:catechol 2,3-dioxygenase-like lactoylglutathione lyase family enzyme